MTEIFGKTLVFLVLDKKSGQGDKGMKFLKKSLIFASNRTKYY